jgi:4-amino-4-deoxy-L-arabinose transferase-like glycosyltransferase
MKVKALPRRWEIALVMTITLLAAGFRLYRLAELPPGLHFDEGFKGVTARSLLEGAPPQLFFESDMGEEPLAIYLVAAALGLLGQQPWVIRLPSAIVGTLTVPLVWWLGRELSRSRRIAPDEAQSRPEQGLLQAQIVGLGTAFVLAILYWHVSLSRIGMEPILVPFFASLAFAALAHGLNRDGPGKPRYATFVVAGLALGGSLYTYKAGYFVPVLAGLFVAYAAVVERGFLRRHGRGLLVAGLVALVAAAPIGLYFARHPANFLQRPASVAVVGGENALESPWQAVLSNLPRVLGSLFVQGDTNPRSNLPGRPALDPFLALLFLSGLGRALAGFRRPLAALPLLWLTVMLLPTLLTEHAPHFGRAIGATPALALLCAWGIGEWGLGIRDWGVGKRSVRPPISNIITVLVAAGLVFSGALTARAYFHTWGSSPDLFYAYDVGLADVSDYVNEIPTRESVYLTPTSREHYTLQFLVHRPLSSFDGRAGLVFPPPGQAATVVVLLREDSVTLPALQRLRPDGEVTWTLNDGDGRPYATAYHLPASASAAPLPGHPVDANFDGKVRLLGYDLEALTDHDVRLTLYWQAVAPLGQEYTVFTHLLGEHNPATGGPYTTSAWQPGEVILDVHLLSLPAGAPPGEYRLEAGLYLLSTMTRLPAVDAAGKRLPDDAVQLGTVGIGK